MSDATEISQPGALMARESAEGAAVFARAAAADHSDILAPLDLAAMRAFLTIARGSSDAAANVLSYEIMRELGLPCTSIPPSVFSLGDGVDMAGTAAIIISQSGASDDLIASAKGARANGATTIAITNRAGSAVEAASHATLPIGAGPELAVPATKSVLGAIGAGMSLISAIKPAYRAKADRAAACVAELAGLQYGGQANLVQTLRSAENVYVIGRGAGLGASLEVALKLKECCALHAEAHSASEVLHGPLQLATKPLTVLMLDTEEDATTDSMNLAAHRLKDAGATLLRIRPSDVGAGGLVPAAAAAVLLNMAYPVIHDLALALGFDPDRPETLAKETLTL